MKKTLALLLLLCGIAGAQTVYYNHPKGVTITSSPAVTVAKVTLPAGTYHVVSKFDVDDTSNGGGGAQQAYEVVCSLWATNIPNVPSPFNLDTDVALWIVTASA